MSAHLPLPTTPAPFNQRLWRYRLWLRHVSTFEKVIMANSCIILLDSAVGWWVTQHNPEPYHYLIDTAFILIASVLGLAVNFILLRAAFAPLHSVLATIRIVACGDVNARVHLRNSGADTAALASAFNTMLDRLEEMHRESAARVLHAQEEERRRLALELHDQTGQSLTALTLHTAAIAQRLEHDKSEAALQALGQLERLGVLAQQTLSEVQVLSRQLRPPLLDDVGLEAALGWLAEDASDRLKVKIAVRTSVLGPEDGESPTIDRDEVPLRCRADVETALFRIAQESVTNAVRHGHAQCISIALSSTSTDLVLKVTDDGFGFDTATLLRAATSRSHSGIGIGGMRERAHLIGGHFTIHANKGQGCVVSVHVPLTAALPSLPVVAERSQDAITAPDSAGSIPSAEMPASTTPASKTPDRPADAPSASAHVLKTENVE